MKDQNSHGDQMNLQGVEAFATTPCHPFEIISRLRTHFQYIHLVAHPMQK